MSRTTILMPLPAAAFAPAQVAIVWQVLREAGHQVVFATPEGRVPAGDPALLSGEGLEPWSCWRPLRKFKLLGLLLRCNARVRAAYQALSADPGFLQPLRLGELEVADFDALVLTGGEGAEASFAEENPLLLALVADFFDTAGDPGRNKVVGAIGRGVIIAARSTSRQRGGSALLGRKTAVLPPRFERLGRLLRAYRARFGSPDQRLPPQGKAKSAYPNAEAELKALLAKPSDLVAVPKGEPWHFRKTSGMFHDRPGDSRAAWVIRDGNYLSARWTGDAYTFARRFVALLGERRERETTARAS